MTRASRFRIAAIVGLVVALGAAGGAASGVWRVTGTGTGNGATGITLAATLTPGAVAADLYPGAGATVTTTASNPNSTPVRIVSLALDTSRGTNGFSVDSAHAGCATSSFGFTTQNNSGNGWNLPASGSLTISLPGSITMASNAASACQGVIVTVFLKAI